MHKIVVAPDSFKGCLSSMEVAESVEMGIRAVLSGCDVVKVNVADGGEGTASAVAAAVGGELMKSACHDPLGRPIRAGYGIAGRMAIVELAAASGLTLLAPSERNPMKTSTLGTGEQILQALDSGCDEILLGIGGSATNDAGTGMLHSLGYRFIDKEGKPIERPCGETLSLIEYIDDSCVPEKVRSAKFIVACDVDTPFCGTNGAAFVFAPQKGADERMVAGLNKGMFSFASVIKRKYSTDITAYPGSGAAGGVGGTCLAILNAELKPGIDMVLDAIDFDRIIKDADLIITGEGCLDSQTAKGKTPAGILARGVRAGIPVIALGGKVKMCRELEALGFSEICQVSDPSVPTEISMRKDIASANISCTVRHFISSF